jgi:hypothetical protein
MDREAEAGALAHAISPNFSRRSPQQTPGSGPFTPGAVNRLVKRELRRHIGCRAKGVILEHPPI